MMDEIEAAPRGEAKIGIVGMGKMGLLHAGLVNTAGSARVVAVCERHPLLLRFARKMLPDVATVSEIGELGRIPIDSVYVTTPPGSHFSVISQLLEQGVTRHIFVEKPLI